MVSSPSLAPRSDQYRKPKWPPSQHHGLPPDLFLLLVKAMVEDIGVAPSDHVEMDPLDASGVVVTYRPLSYVIQGRKDIAASIADGSTAIFEVHGRHTTTSSEVLEYIDRKSAIFLDRWVISLPYIDSEIQWLSEKHKSRGYFDLRVSSRHVVGLANCKGCYQEPPRAKHRGAMPCCEVEGAP
jgi:hypothetical protein